MFLAAIRAALHRIVVHVHHSDRTAQKAGLLRAGRNSVHDELMTNPWRNGKFWQRAARQIERSACCEPRCALLCFWRGHRSQSWSCEGRVLSGIRSPSASSQVRSCFPIRCAFAKFFRAPGGAETDPQRRKRIVFGAGVELKFSHREQSLFNRIHRAAKCFEQTRNNSLQLPSKDLTVRHAEVTP